MYNKKWSKRIDCNTCLISKDQTYWNSQPSIYRGKEHKGNININNMSTAENMDSIWRKLIIKRMIRLLTCYLSPNHLLLDSKNLKWTCVGKPEKATLSNIHKEVNNHLKEHEEEIYLKGPNNQQTHQEKGTFNKGDREMKNERQRGTIHCSNKSEGDQFADL